MPSNHLILCNPLLLLPSIFPSIRVFSNESALRIRWPKYWSFSFNTSPFNEHPGLISLGWTGWISLSPRDAQESSPMPQYKSTSSLVLSFLYSPTLIFIHGYWKNQSFHCMDLCPQIDVSVIKHYFTVALGKPPVSLCTSPTITCKQGSSECCGPNTSSSLYIP